MLSFVLHMRIGEQDLLLPVTGHIVFTTVADQGWLAGQKPSLDATRRLAAATYRGNAVASQFFAFFEPLVGRDQAGSPNPFGMLQTNFHLHRGPAEATSAKSLLHET